MQLPAGASQELCNNLHAFHTTLATTATQSQHLLFDICFSSQLQITQLLLKLCGNTGQGQYILVSTATKTRDNNMHIPCSALPHPGDNQHRNSCGDNTSTNFYLLQIKASTASSDAGFLHR
jgi:hypothetical protein